MPARRRAGAHARSAELRGLLAELTREHACNQALMRQELSFLDHLLRLRRRAPTPAYCTYAAGGAPPVARRAAQRHTARLDLQA